MDSRTKLLLFLAILAGVFATAGCSYNQPSRFQTAFLPPAPMAVPPAEFLEPPVVQPNLYLKDAPTFTAPNALPAMRTRGDNLIQRAEERFQSGRKAYHAENYAEARTEFDAAIDLMLEAANYGPSDHQGYEQRLDRMVDAVHRYDLGGLGAAASTEEARFEKAPLEDILQMTFPVDPRLKDKVREQVGATVSQLPLSVNDAVLGYVNYFNNRGRKTLIAGLQRAGRYRAMINRILDEEGIPQELIHLAQAESGFLPRAVSRARAGGMWQFLAWRGQQYGLMQTPYSDDRMDPEKATRAAARHLRDLFNEFGDWYLAIAAYNCGPVAVENAVERTGYADFWELRDRHVIPAETTNYVPIILALTIMEKNAAEYGIDNITPEPPLEYDPVEMTSPTSLALVSDLTETSVSELAVLNPALLRSTAPAGYSLRVPKGTGNTLMAALETVPQEKRAAWRMHRVGTGETLASIAKRYGTAPASIVAANHLAAPLAVEGDRLLIPAVMRVEPAAKRPVRGTTAARHRASARPGSSAAAHTAASRASTSVPAHRKPASTLTQTASR